MGNGFNVENCIMIGVGLFWIGHGARCIGTKRATWTIGATRERPGDEPYSGHFEGSMAVGVGVLEICCGLGISGWAIYRAVAQPSLY